MSRSVSMLIVAGLLACGPPGGGGDGPAEGPGESGETDSAETGDGDGDGDSDCEDPLVALFGVSVPAHAVGVGEIQVAGSTAFVCSADGGLSVWTIGDASITPASEVLSPDGLPVGCKRLAVDADAERVLIARTPLIDEDGYVAAYDVSDPSQPALVATWTSSASVEGVALASGRAYVALRDQGLVVLEEDGLGGFVQVGAFVDAESDARGMVVRDGTLFVAEGVYGLRTFDLGGNDPVLLGSLGLGGMATQLDLAVDRAYVATLTGIVVADVSNVASPRLLGRQASPGVAVAVAVDADARAYLADWNELRVWDLADPAAPLQIAAERLPTAGDHSRIRGLSVLEDGRVLAGEWGGLHLYEHRPGCETPEVALSRETLRFDPLEGASSRDELLLVRNEGPGVLTITDIVSSDPAVSTDATGLSVPPGGSVSVEVLLTSDAALEGTLTLVTSDPDEAMLDLPWETAAFKRDLDDPAPSFLMIDLDANAWRTSDLLGHAALLAYFATW